ncbi:MAG: tetratricopeptide repeat protein [Chloroflexi bacterium]|nr:tetratricopeptide repeat protein [Chloroflexota bacterium]
MPVATIREKARFPMVVLEIFVPAGLKFAAGAAGRLVRDARVSGMLSTLYPEAALRVVDYYDRRIKSEKDRKAWNSLIDLLKDERCGDYLSVGGTLGHDEIRLLQVIYTCETPSVFDVVERMALEMGNVCLESLPGEPRVQAYLTGLTAAAQRVRTMELGGQFNELKESLRDNLYLTEPSSATPPAALSLPSDEDYRVERPQLEELSQRLLSEDVVGIGGTVGGVGKSLLAIRYARQHHAGKTVYVPLDTGAVRGAMVSAGNAINLQLDSELTDVQASRVLRDSLSRFEGLLILDNAEDPVVVQMLLPLPGGSCKTIITSRDEALLRSAAGSDPVMLDTFTRKQSRDCFGAHLGEGPARQQSGQIDQLCDLLGHLPLAVDVAAATISDEGLPVAEWLEIYPDERRQLQALGPAEFSGNESPDEIRFSRVVRAVLRLSLRNLSASARRLLYAVACFDPASGGPQLLVVPVAQLEADDQAEAGRVLNRLHQRAVLRAAEAGFGGKRYTMHRLMREVVRQEAGERLGEFEARFLTLIAGFPQILQEMVGQDRSTDAILAFHQEAANLEIVAKALVGDAALPPGGTESLPRQRAEFAAHVAQFAALRWDHGLCRRLLEHAVRDSGEAHWNWLHANTLKALGDLDLREALLTDARARYDEALPIFRDIQSRLGQANTLQALGDLDLREDLLADARARYDEALTSFRKALEIQPYADINREYIARCRANLN